MLAAALTTVLFSISAVCGRRAGSLLGGTEANFWRLVFATLLLAVYAHTVGVGLRTVAFPILFISGAIGFGIIQHTVDRLWCVLCSDTEQHGNVSPAGVQFKQSTYIPYDGSSPECQILTTRKGQSPYQGGPTFATS